MKEKQVIRVLGALQIGAQTSREVSAVTGLTVKTSSALLSELAKYGVIKRTKENATRYNRRGRNSHYYKYPITEIAEQARARINFSEGAGKWNPGKP